VDARDGDVRIDLEIEAEAKQPRSRVGDLAGYHELFQTY
jgi:hypothetical protein